MCVKNLHHKIFNRRFWHIDTYLEFTNKTYNKIFLTSIQLSKRLAIDWLIDLFVFEVISAIFRWSLHAWAQFFKRWLTLTSINTLLTLPYLVKRFQKINLYTSSPSHLRYKLKQCFHCFLLLMFNHCISFKKMIQL